MRQKIYQGSRKIIYQAEEEFALVMAFTDKVTLEDGKVLEASGKAALNNSISSFIMNKLDMLGVENHFIEKINMIEQLVQAVDVFPIQVSVANVACGRFVKEFAMEEGYVFDTPIIDLKVRSRELKYPVINEHQLVNFGWLTKYEITEVKNKSIRIFDFLTGLFMGMGIRLVECTLEFGRVFNEDEFVIMLADEITPDNCRLWNIDNNEKLGFELLSENPEKAINSYQLIANQLKNYF